MMNNHEKAVKNKNIMIKILLKFRQFVTGELNILQEFVIVMVITQHKTLYRDIENGTEIQFKVF
jgi:hypothetical protein